MDLRGFEALVTHVEWGMVCFEEVVLKDVCFLRRRFILRQDIIPTGSFTKSGKALSEFPVCICIEFNIGQVPMKVVGKHSTKIHEISDK